MGISSARYFLRCLLSVWSPVSASDRISCGRCPCPVVGSTLYTRCWCRRRRRRPQGYDGFKADAWSCGVVLYTMLTQSLPFDRELSRCPRCVCHSGSPLPSCSSTARGLDLMTCCFVLSRDLSRALPCVCPAAHGGEGHRHSVSSSSSDGLMCPVLDFADTSASRAGQRSTASVRPRSSTSTSTQQQRRR